MSRDANPFEEIETNDAERDARKLALARHELRSVREICLAEAVRYYQTASATLGIEAIKDDGQRIATMAKTFENYITGESA